MILFVLINFFFFGYTFYYLLVCTTTSLLYTLIHLHIRAHTHNTLTYNMYRYFSCYFQTGISFYTQKKALLFLLQTFLFWYCNVVFGVVGLFNYLLKTRNVVVVVVY